MNTGARFRFGASLERLDYVIDAVFRQRPDLIDVTNSFQARNFFIAHDHRKTRVHTRRRSFALLKRMVLYFGLPAAFAWASIALCSVDHVHDASPLMFMMIVMIGGSFVIDYMLEFAKSYKIKQNMFQQLNSDPKNKVRNVAYEQQLEWKFDLGYLGLFLTYAIAWCAPHWF
jgi:hypothetical protein